jgi:anti-sigma B factor antagonist
MFDIDLESGTEGIVVKMRGELDFSRVQTCLPVMSEVKRAQTKNYVADLSGLTLIDSSGLGMLISIRNSANQAGGTFIIRGAHGQVAEILKMTRFDLLATIE